MEWPGASRRKNADLPRITQPLLIFRSVEDHVVDSASAPIITSGVSSRDVTERMLENSYHVATLDNDAPTIFAGSADFFRGLLPAPTLQSGDDHAL